MTEAELLQAVRDALADQEDPEGFYTTEEWCEMFGLRGEATRKRLRALKATGKLEISQVMREGLDDKVQPVRAYRFVP